MSSFAKGPATMGADIVVRVVSTYLPQESDLSDPGDLKYVFAYHIEIENRGARTVQLLSRHWWITDAHDSIREVEGEGVVGQQPIIAPGQAFSYASWCVISTSWGRMRGTYTLLAAGGETIELPIPQFNLTTSGPPN
ncbi:MAG: Co2+/Mg2+ efflux protein ApaG [Polyangia bacterium]|jgi:ApaG protein